MIPLSEALLARIRRVTDELNQQGLRVVAVANKILPATDHEYGVADESDLILEGYIAFLDPPKESTAPALAALKKNGVTVKILTGDNELVAAKVCKDVGLDAEHILRGSEIRIDGRRHAGSSGCAYHGVCQADAAAQRTHRPTAA